MAAAAAAALVLGPAGAAAAHGHMGPRGPKAPSGTTTAPVTLKTVGIKGHSTVDLAKVTTTTAISLRASVRDARNVVPASATVDVTLGVFDKKVRGTQVAGTSSTTVSLAPTSTSGGKSKRYAGSAVLATVWTTDQVAALKAALKPGDKAYACIATADLAGVEGEAKSVQTRKRLGEHRRPVRDCVKVVDSTPVPTS